MKIFSRELIRQADAYTISHEPIASAMLMERAARQFTLYFLKHFSITGKIHVFCGKGNNGGDGLVVSRLLLDKHYQVVTYILEYADEASDDFTLNYNLLKNYQQAEIHHITDENFEFNFAKNDLIVDALWGTGLSRPIQGFSGKIIEKINSSSLPVVAIDIPSGTFCDSFNEDDAKIKAHFTISFQLPKLAFFIPENRDFVGRWRVVDIGLSDDFIQNTDTSYFYSTKAEISKLLKPRNKFDHKGNFGHSLLMAGSYGKMGAAVLGAKACMRSGTGLLTVFIPECGYSVLQTAVPEAMTIVANHDKMLTNIPDTMAFDAAAIGPGIGTNDLTADALNLFLKKTKYPVVLDADAINIIAARQTWMYAIPRNSILTPHPGEFDRLAGKSSNHFQRLEKAIQIAKKHQIIIVLKGHYTAVVSPEGKIFFNSTGNPGMATAGSGDVLTGVILAFLAQGYEPLHAARLAVFLHGLAGDMAAEQKSQHGLIASDIIDYLPEAFINLSNAEQDYEKK
ncbi:MAG: NAD(P)H-hydrate dehydratase [Sphingobacteriales bacterium]|nr:NAD(P)H-hydrate dehydratase [Sphingobacteriales bacterium]